MFPKECILLSNGKNAPSIEIFPKIQGETSPTNLSCYFVLYWREMLTALDKATLFRLLSNFTTLSNH